MIFGYELQDVFSDLAASAKPFAMNMAAAQEAAAADADDMKLGVATYSFREFRAISAMNCPPRTDLPVVSF